MPLCLHEDLPHKASQGTAPILNWPCSELGCLEGSFRDEGWFLASFRLLWTRHPGTAKKFCAVLLAFGFCASTSVFSQVGPGSLVLFVQSASATTPSYASRVGCHWLRQSQCDRVSPTPSPSRAFCTAPLFSCQAEVRHRRGWTTLWPSTRKHPPNAGPDVCPSDFS